VRLDVVEEWNLDRAAVGVPGQRRQDEKRQPGDARDDQHAPAHQLQRIAGQMRPPEQLEQRSAEDQREVRPPSGLVL